MTAAIRRLGRPRIDVIGPVAVRSRDGSRSVGGRPGRALVALAVAEPHVGLTLEQLADVVWSGSPPPTHRPALHVHLGTVRRALGDAGGLVRTGERYALDRDVWDTDAAIAAALVGAAHDELAAAPARAAELVEHALALWRGDPCTVDGEPVDLVAASQLDALRRDAEELLVECLLAGRDAAGAERVALELVGAEPLREHRWGQLLRARYLAGRTADALATYQAARNHLREALGIEPGLDLRLLEAAALTHDRARLRLPAAPGAVLASWSPPAASGAFVGREAACARVAELVVAGRPVLVTGAPGVGKSRLAAEVVRRLHADCAWVDLRDTDVDLDVDALREWTRQHPDGVVVFDDADAGRDAAATAISDIRRHAPSVGVLVTSRVRLPIDAAVEALPPLDIPAPGDPETAIESASAVVALRAALAELAPTAAVTSRDAARICHYAGGLPLALRLVADAARALPVGALVYRAATVTADEIRAAVDAVLSITGEQARRAFDDLALVGAGFDLDLGARVSALDGTAFEAAIVELAEHGLVVARPAQLQPYSMLEPIREVAERRLDDTGRRASVESRLVDACIERARQLDRRASAHDPDLARHTEAELPRIRRAVAHLARSGDAERALRLVCRLEGPLYVLGWWAEKIELFDAALAIRGPATAMRARAHAFRARPGPMHLFDLEHAERAEAIASELDDDGLLLAFTRSIRAVGLWWTGELDAAMQLSAAAAKRFAAADRPLEWSEARKFLGVAMVFAGDVADGLAVQQDALRVVRRSVETPFAVAHSLAYLGHCHRMLGNDDAALTSWSEARTLCRQIGNRGTAIHVLLGLADLAAERGGTEDALALVAESLDLIDAARAWTYEPWAWTIAVRAHTGVGDLDAAVASGRRAVEGIHRVPTGESVRLAGELAHLAVARLDAVAAARLLGVIDTTDDRREMPFRPPSESTRLDEVRQYVEHRLGAQAGDERRRGRLLTVAEAAGSLLG